jgi:hypothetical protein
MFHPTLFDISDYIFSFGLFFTLFLLFAKFLPVVNMAEVKTIIKSSSEKLPKSVSGVAKGERVANPTFNKDVE